jgi:hypothetical protein
MLPMLLLVLAGAARADSIFSANGLGEWVLGTDVRGRGMGGVGLAVDDPSNMGMLNPALLALVKSFTMHAEAMPELRRIEDDEDRVSTPRATNFPLLRAALDVPRIGAFGLGFATFTDVNYELAGSAALDTLTFRNVLEGQNGWNRLVVSYARQLRPDLLVGLDLDVLLGSYVDVWTTTPDESGLAVTTDSLVVNHSRGPVVRLGTLYRPSPALRLAATLTAPRSIGLRPEIRTDRSARRLATSTLDLPLSVGLGTSYWLDAHWLVAADLLWTGWERTELGSTRIAHRTRNVTRLGIGAEYMSNRSGEGRSLAGRIGWRVGYSREPWHYVKVGGEPIVDHFVSVGAGIPFPEESGYLDLSIELGQRGDRELHGATERVLRIGVGVTLREVVAVGRVE